MSEGFLWEAYVLVEMLGILWASGVTIIITI